MELQSAMAKLSTESTTAALHYSHYSVKLYEIFMKWCSKNNLKPQYKITGNSQHIILTTLLFLLKMIC